MDREPAMKDIDNVLLLVKGIATDFCFSLKELHYVLSREDIL